jgi:hypothetical protein
MKQDVTPHNPVDVCRHSSETTVNWTAWCHMPQDNNTLLCRHCESLKPNKMVHLKDKIRKIPYVKHLFKRKINCLDIYVHQNKFIYGILFSNDV